MTIGARAFPSGKAAEHLVCADLLLQGYNTFLAGESLPYDLVVEVDNALLRLQVKSTLKMYKVHRKACTRLAYIFRVGRQRPNGTSTLTQKDCDIVALCALDIRKIAYLRVEDVGFTVRLWHPEQIPTRRVTARGLRISTFVDFPFTDALHPQATAVAYKHQTLRELDGEHRTLSAWAHQYGDIVKPATARKRLRKGWPLEIAFTQPAWPRRSWKAAVEGV